MEPLIDPTPNSPYGTTYEDIGSLIRLLGIKFQTAEDTFKEDKRVHVRLTKDGRYLTWVVHARHNSGSMTYVQRDPTAANLEWVGALSVWFWALDLLLAEDADAKAKLGEAPRIDLGVNPQPIQTAPDLPEVGTTGHARRIGPFPSRGRSVTGATGDNSPAGHQP